MRWSWPERTTGGDNTPEWPQPRDAQRNAIRRAPLMVLMRVFPSPHRRPFVADVTPRRARSTWRRRRRQIALTFVSFVWPFRNGTAASCFVVVVWLFVLSHYHEQLQPRKFRPERSRDASNASVSHDYYIIAPILLRSRICNKYFLGSDAPR